MTGNAMDHILKAFLNIEFGARQALTFPKPLDLKIALYEVERNCEIIKKELPNLE